MAFERTGHDLPLESVLRHEAESSAEPRERTGSPSLQVIAGADLLARRRRTIVSIALSNFVPLVGALLFGWPVYPIMVLFWIENVSIGIATVAKLRATKRREPRHEWSQTEKTALENDMPTSGTTPKQAARAFARSYFGFTLVHGLFVFALFGIQVDPVTREAIGLQPLSAWQVLAGTAAIAVGQIYAYYAVFVGLGERDRLTPRQVQSPAIMRMLVMHVGLILAGIAIGRSGSASGLAVLVLIKIASEVYTQAYGRGTPGVGADPV